MNIPIIFIRPWHAELKVFCFIFNNTQIDFMKYFFMLFVCLTLSHFGYTQNDDRGYIVKVGDKAPDITITYTDGTRKKLSDFRGKIVMLQFTASWCGVCRKEMPFIEKDIDIIRIGRNSLSRISCCK